MTRLSLAGLWMVLYAVAWAPAQQPTPAEDADAARPVVIAEGPLAIDPAKHVPPPLAAKATVTFQGESLLEFADWFAREHSITVLLDKAALEDLNISLGEPVYDKLQNDSLYLLLDRLRKLELAWYYEDGLVTITTEEDAEELVTTTTYNLGDLLDDGFERDAISETIFSSVVAESWAENGGGDSELQWLGDVLFVSQTAEGHRQVAGLLAALRDHGRRTYTYDPPVHEQLRKKLEQPISIKLVQTPLVVAVQKIGEAAGADLSLDQLALEEIGVRERSPVTINLENRSLRTILRAVARNLELTWLLRDGVLWVTSEEQAEVTLKTAVYDVRDLCRDADEGDALTDALISQVDSGSWAENGGGEAEICFPKDGVMVVSQTEQNHIRLLSLLDRYRDALRQSKPRDDQADDPDEVLTRYYRMPRQMAAGLAQMLPTLLEAEGWNNLASARVLVVDSADEVHFQKASLPRVTEHSVLIITQTRSTHDKIATLIEKVRNGDAPPAVEGESGYGGGGGGFGGGYFSIGGNETEQAQ